MAGRRPGGFRRSYFSRVPTRQIATALWNYRAQDSHDLALTAGETVTIVEDLDNLIDLDDPEQYLWCSARGEEGLVPRYCLLITGIGRR